MAKMNPGNSPGTASERREAVPPRLRLSRFVGPGLVAGLGIGIAIVLLRPLVDGSHWLDDVTDAIVGGIIGAILGGGWFLVRRSAFWIRNHRLRFSLRMMLLLVTVVPLAIYVSWCLIVVLPLKSRYEESRAEISSVVLTEVPMNAATERLLSDVRDNWTEKCNDLDGLVSRALEIIHRTLSVANVVALFTYRMPDFSILSPRRNYEPIAIGVVQAQILPITVDHLIHVSHDRRVALIRVSSDTVFLFEDDDQGMREMVYLRSAAFRQTSGGVTGAGP